MTIDRPEAALGFAPSNALRPTVPLYLSVGLIAGAVIALQICIMRIFAVGSWAHFGSLVVSLAMLAFGLVSAAMCVCKSWVERHWQGVATGAVLSFGPLMVIANLLAQQLPFNAIFLVADPNQKWRLAANFLLYLLPFLSGALFLGTVFLKADKTFARVYFADLVGAGLGGLVLLAGMFFVTPQNLILVPLALWFLGGLGWLSSVPGRQIRRAAFLGMAAAAAIAIHVVMPVQLGLHTLATSDYKGVSYARKFPDSRRVYRNVSPFGDLEVYSSSYLHFAPGLSDNAAFNLPAMPANAYLGLYVDGEGPNGIIRNLSDADAAYFRFLPMFYPYLINKSPEVFVMQFGGGISTAAALHEGSKAVTIAEANPAVLSAFRNSPVLVKFTGDVLHDPRVSVVDYDGRLFLAHTDKRYDVIDLSLADSAGLSSPGGFAIVEKYSYTREAMVSAMRALKPGGILSVTLWNKEEPPKSVLKLYTTLAAAAKIDDPDHAANDVFVASAYLSTATVLYKKGGFTADEIGALRDHTRAMSFDEIYYPGMPFDGSQTKDVLSNYHDLLFASDASSQALPGAPSASAPGTATGAGLSDGPDDESVGAQPTILPSILMGRLAWHHLLFGGWPGVADAYVFDTRPLTNDRPYFAAYIKPHDLPQIIDRLELVQDEWGYLLLWATLGIATVAATSLVFVPVIFGWRSVFSVAPGKFGTVVYFACLGLGYIMVEVGLIANFTLALNNATVSASVLITSMLIFSGLGSLCAERTLPRARTILPVILAVIGAILILYGSGLDRVLGPIGTLPYGLRLLCCVALVGLPAFFMGFPMPTAMTSLARLDKEHMFLWAWGINGCFSVIGAAAVPLVATSFGLSSVLAVSGCAYLLAIPAFFAVLRPKAIRSEGTWTSAAPHMSSAG
jgi:hypothetical protein